MSLFSKSDSSSQSLFGLTRVNVDSIIINLAAINDLNILNSLNGISIDQLEYLTTLSSNVQTQLNNTYTKTQVNTIIGDYVPLNTYNTEISDLMRDIELHLTINAFNTAMLTYSTSTQMNTAISTALLSYSTTNAVGNLISTALLSYSTSTQMNTAITNALSSYVLSSHLTTNYSTTSATNTLISNALLSYITASNLTSQLSNYVLSSSLTASINTALSAYSTTSGTSTQIINQLVNYPTFSQLSNTIASYVLTSYLTGSYSTTTQMNTAITNALSSYVLSSYLSSNYTTTSALNTALLLKLNILDVVAYGYITNSVSNLTNYSTTTTTNSAITSALLPYALITSLAAYSTPSAVTSAISGALVSYSTTTSMNTILSSYVLTSTLSTYVSATTLTGNLLDYLPKIGGAITGNLSVAGNFIAGNISVNSTMLSDNITLNSSALYDAEAKLIIQNNSSFYGNVSIKLVGRSELQNDGFHLWGGRNNMIFSNQLIKDGPVYNRFAFQCMQTGADNPIFGLLAEGNLYTPAIQWDKDGICTINTSLNGISSQKLGYLTTINSDVQTQIDNILNGTTPFCVNNTFTTSNYTLNNLYTQQSTNKFFINFQNTTTLYGQLVLKPIYQKMTDSLISVNLYSAGLRISQDLTPCNATNMLEIAGNMTITGSINGITSTTLAYLDATSSIQTQFNNIGNLYNATASPSLYNINTATINIGSSYPWNIASQSSGLFFSLSGSWKFSYDINGAYHQLSDRRMKKNIIQLKQDDSLNIIKKLEACEYNYIDSDIKKSIGYIAQDVQLIDPLAVSQHGDILSINYNNLFVHNINATKNLYEIIISQATQIDELNKRLNKLENIDISNTLVKSIIPIKQQ